MTDQPELRLVFLDTHLFEDGSVLRGGALITDIETKPYEFRCTSPVRPTTLQRVLYGETLDEYIHVELIGIPLIRAAREKSGLILVQKAVLLRIRPHLPCPVVLVRHDQKIINSSDENNENALQSVTISSHREYPAEVASAQALLAPLMQRRDVLEPFERLRVALTEAHRQNIGDSTTEAKHA
jgi:hypothetical protein